MDHEKQRARYIAGTEGAPPVPPPGGYRNARRASSPALPAYAPQASVVAADAPKQPANGLGWAALGAAVLFALILLGTLLAGGTDLLYGVTMLALQLVVVAVVVAALVTPRGRMLGAVGLAITLVLNVATVGAMSALQTSASGSYDGQKTEEQKHEEAYPGVKDTNPQVILAQPSLEELRTRSESLLADIRARVSEEFGYTWVSAGSEDLRPERNGYGGESMLVQYTSESWATAEPIQDYERKLEVMDVISEVLEEHELYILYSFNESTSGIDPSMIEKLYGSDDPRSQHTWEYYMDNYPDPMRLYANIYDLSNDRTGDFRATRQAQHDRTGEPLEGLQIAVIANQLLSEADREEFETKLEEYPNF